LHQSQKLKSQNAQSVQKEQNVQHAPSAQIAHQRLNAQIVQRVMHAQQSAQHLSHHHALKDL
jgi:hypothetical protein